MNCAGSAFHPLEVEFSFDLGDSPTLQPGELSSTCIPTD
jgi:hypothetical protein